MKFPKPSRELVERWMEVSGGSDVIDIVCQVAERAAAWGYMHQKYSPPDGDWHYISFRENQPF